MDEGHLKINEGQCANVRTYSCSFGGGVAEMHAYEQGILICMSYMYIHVVVRMQ